MEETTTDNGGGNPLDIATDLLPFDREQLDAWASRARELDDRTRSYIRANPTSALIGAVVIGFFLGRWLR